MYFGLSFCYIYENIVHRKKIDSQRALSAEFVEGRTLDHRKVAGLNLTGARLCVLEQDTASSLLSTGSTQENVPTLVKNCD